jgi:hypothetical protein
MTWFKVDDKLHSNSKIRKVLAEAPSALALWTVAGSWSSDNLTDGFVPDHQLPWLIPNGAEEMARQLVAARLWKRVRGGHQFHEWAEDGDGTKRNPTRVEVEADRLKKAEAGRKGGLARAKNANRGGVEEKDSDFERVSKEVIHRQESTAFGRRMGVENAATSRNVASRGQAPASALAKAPASTLLDPPTRPDPTYRGGGSLTATNDRAHEEPPSRCREHQDDPDPPACRRCRSAREAHEQWQASERRRLADAPKCPKHRGQLAHNCALCRAEQLGSV